MEYLAPEAAAGRPLATAADIYAFGVTLLQLLTGSQAGGLVSHVASVKISGEHSAIMDPCAGSWPSEDATQLINLALRSVQQAYSLQSEPHHVCIAQRHLVVYLPMQKSRIHVE